MKEQRQWETSKNRGKQWKITWPRDVGYKETRGELRIKLEKVANASNSENTRNHIDYAKEESRKGKVHENEKNFI